MRFFRLLPLIVVSSICVVKPFPLMAAPAVPAKSAVKAGEIALEGVVLSIDWEKLELRLEAQLFTLPNGKSGAIKPAKEKLIHLKIAGIPVNTLKERIQVGQKLRFFGRDSGAGKPLEASAFRVLTTPEKPAEKPEPKPLAEAPDPVKPVEVVPDTPPKPLFPLEGTDGGFTFRLDSAKITTSPSDTRPTLRTSFVTLGADKKEIPYYEWKNGLKLRMLSPDGLLIDEIGWSNKIVSNRVPKYDFVWLEFTGRDPNAPDGLSLNQANGWWQDELTIDIGAPKPNQVVKVNKDFKTPQGATLHVTDIKFVPQGEGGQVQVRANAIAAPGGAMLAKFAGGRVLHPAGEYITEGGGTTGEKDVWRIDIRQVPPGENWKLSLTVAQVSRNLAVSSHRFKVRLKLPIKGLPQEVLDAKTAGQTTLSPLDTIIATNSAQNADARVDIESTAAVFDIAMVTKMVLRDLSNDPMKVWDYKDSKAWDENGNELRSLSQEQIRALEFERDGSPAGIKVKTRGLQFVFEASKRPKTAKLHLDLESRRMLEYGWTITTALPVNDEPLFPDAEVISNDGAPFILRQVRLYKTLAELPGNYWNEGLPERGLALVFEARPFIPGAYLNMGQTMSNDEMGRPLSSSTFSPTEANWLQGNVFSKERQTDTWTLLLSEPPADSKTVEVQSKTSEVGPTMGTTSFDIENIAITPKQQ